MGVALAALATVLRELPPAPGCPEQHHDADAASVWEGGGSLAGWRPNYRHQRRVSLTEAFVDEFGASSSRCIDVGVSYSSGDGSFRIEVDGEIFDVLSCRLEGHANDISRQMRVEIEGALRGRAVLTVSVAFHDGDVALWVEGEHSSVPIVLRLPSVTSGGAAGIDSNAAASAVSAPMPGKVVKVAVEKGQKVDA